MTLDLQILFLFSQSLQNTGHRDQLQDKKCTTYNCYSSFYFSPYWLLIICSNMQQTPRPRPKRPRPRPKGAGPTACFPSSDHPSCCPTWQLTDTIATRDVLQNSKCKDNSRANLHWPSWHGVQDKTSLFISSVRSSNSHPDLLLIHHHPTPTFSDHTGPQHWTFTF